MSRKTSVTLKLKPKRIGTEDHHCSQCNRPKLHEVFEHKDGVLMKCPCGYKFVEIRIDIEAAKEEIE